MNAIYGHMCIFIGKLHPLKKIAVNFTVLFGRDTFVTSSFQ